MGQGASAALFHAAATGDAEQINTILDQGADINKKEEVHWVSFRNMQVPSAVKLYHVSTNNLFCRRASGVHCIMQPGVATNEQPGT